MTSSTLMLYADAITIKQEMRGVIIGIKRKMTNSDLLYLPMTGAEPNVDLLS
jgi:hypothetical protein